MSLEYGKKRGSMHRFWGLKEHYISFYLALGLVIDVPHDLIVTTFCVRTNEVIAGIYLLWLIS